MREFTSVISFELNVNKRSFGICFEILGYLAFSAQFLDYLYKFPEAKDRVVFGNEIKTFFLLICELTSLPFSN